MRLYNILILTDHTHHHPSNSLYTIARALYNHPQANSICVATRANPKNAPFFLEKRRASLYASYITKDFGFCQDGAHFLNNIQRVNIEDFDMVWLRIPPPFDKAFSIFLGSFPSYFVNNPEGIYETGSKEFLMNFKEVCPSMYMCHTFEDIEDVLDFKDHPIVLKPLRAYGGQGIIKIELDTVWIENTKTTFKDFERQYSENPIPYLAVEYLAHVTEGDKRINVVNGNVITSSLRVPPLGSWLCNVSMGGTAQPCEVSDEEYEIIKKINPLLSEKGILVYGIDTLMGNKGKRVLSEINTTSVGGFSHAPSLDNMINEVLQSIELRK